MKGLWTSVSAAALLASGASAAVAASSVAESALLSTHVVRLELADATRAPAGTLYVGIANPGTAYAFSLANDDTAIAGHLVVEPPAAFSLDTAELTSLADLTVSRAVTDGVAVEFGYGDTGLADPHRLSASGLFDGLFASDSALSSPYASLADGGVYAGVRLTFGDVGLRFGVGARDSMRFATGAPLSPMPTELLASAGNGVSARTVSAGVDWQITDWASVAVTGTQAEERGTILGSELANSLAVAPAATTSALSVSARVGFGDGWVTTVAFDEGITQLNVKPTWMMPGGSLYSQGYGIALAKEGLFGDDALGFSVSRPLQSNGIVFDNGFGARQRVLPSNLTNANGAQQSDIQLGYVTTFLDGSLALQANAGYQMNANGTQGRDGVTAAARARIDF